METFEANVFQENTSPLPKGGNEEPLLTPLLTPLPWNTPSDLSILVEHSSALRACLSVESSKTNTAGLSIEVSRVVTSETLEAADVLVSSRPGFEEEFEEKVVEAAGPPKLRYAHWTKEEDDLLEHAVTATGGGPPFHWSKISKMFKGCRDQSQCRSRWRRIRSRLESSGYDTNGTEETRGMSSRPSQTKSPRDSCI